MKIIKMKTLKTNRISLIPLNLEQLEMLKEGMPALAEYMDLKCDEFKLNTDESFLQQFYEMIDTYFIAKINESPANIEWLTQRIIVENKDKHIVGGIGTSGMPNENGEVMIGYFIADGFEGYGYASEAVRTLVDDLRERLPGVRSIVADTPAEHIASQRVLSKNGFEFDGITEEGYRWRIVVSV